MVERKNGVYVSRIIRRGVKVGMIAFVKCMKFIVQTVCHDDVFFSVIEVLR